MTAKNITAMSVRQIGYIIGLIHEEMVYLIHLYVYHQDYKILQKFELLALSPILISSNFQKFYFPVK
ncbi:MAG: hypothetical protein INQ03_22865 [Candidatus Heimdallarchaeota archaeon]|nr:hypothetical protein [Candidatus Heimdallarchaeota archaeon]